MYGKDFYVGTGGYEFIEFRHVDDKAVLLLKHPPLNILNQAMCREIIDFLKAFLGCNFNGLLITTEGKHFCAGVDVGEHLPGRVETMLPIFDELCLILAEFPLPTVAAVSGACMGGGLELARACRQVIAWNPETIKLGLPEINLNCFPPFGLAAFPRISTSKDDLKSMIRFLLTGKTLAGKEDSHLKEALQIGLVDEKFTGTLEELVEHVDFSFVADMPAWNDRFQGSDAISDHLVQEAMTFERDAKSRLNQGIMNIVISVLIGCSYKRDLRSALKFAEKLYLELIASHPAYEEALTKFLESQSKK